MVSLLAKLIYPHFHNQHRPYAIRHQALFIFVTLVALTQIIANALVGDPKILGYATNITKSDIVKLTNQERASAGITTLRENSLLDQAAALKAADMFKKDYWAHFAQDGTTPWYFFGQVGYKYTWAGENLARDFQTSGGVVAGWMASTAGHRENVLNKNFTEIGVAVKNGILQGEETTLVVQLFARPVSYTAAAPTGESGSSQVGEGKEVKDELSLQTGTEEDSQSQKSQEVAAAEGVRKPREALNVATMIQGLSTSQKTSFSLLFVLGSLFVIDSAVIFRKRHQREGSHSGMHASVVFVLMATLLAQSLGSIL